MEVFLKNQPLPEGIETKMDDTFFFADKGLFSKAEQKLGAYQ